MAFYKKQRLTEPTVALRRILALVCVTMMFVSLTVFLIRGSSVAHLVARNDDNDDDDDGGGGDSRDDHLVRRGCSDFILKIKRSDMSLELERRNKMPPRNIETHSKLSKDHIPIVLYVHNRPQYLKIVVQSLSQVDGINETLLIVSHDGYFEEMNKIVEGIKFCQVKQIFAPYSPHIFPNSFPGISPSDCKQKDNATEKVCTGNPDQYGNHRSPRIVSLKHHWWWMMNTVWDGLTETKHHSGHIVFIEEDHFIFPNAYRNLQVLVAIKPHTCPECYAINLAPANVESRGEGGNGLIAEKIGNIGYALNRSIWNKIHQKTNKFCLFDDYNWDITMWATVYPSFEALVYTLRGPKTSAVHFGKCGLHQGHGENTACVVNGEVYIPMEEADKVVNINPRWKIREYSEIDGYKAGFKGWGGWGDVRDRKLCLSFANIYRKMNNSPCS